MKRIGLIAVSALALAACDVVRVPGDGRTAPDPAPVIPAGAPGPAPPTFPVTDPWGEGEDETPTEIPISNPVDPESPMDTPTPSGEDADPSPADDPDPNPPENPADSADTDTNAEIPEPPRDVSEVEPAPDSPSDSESDAPTPSESDTPVDDPSTPDDAAEAGGEEDDLPAVTPPEPLPVKFEYFPAGDLIPGTGTGRGDDTVYAPDMLFPIKSAATWPQSMVYRLGGAVGGDQCDPANYEIPWRDNFCEQRSSTRNTPMCPTNRVHQGQDIRVGTASDCNALRRQAKVDRGLHEVVAVEDGIIQHIGTYSVRLKGTETGNLYSYLHLNMRRLRVSALDTVSAGDTLGFVSNDFGTTPTTFHLHFEIKAPIEGEGIIHVPPYMSLVRAYERREGGIGEPVVDDNVLIASAPVIVDPSKLVE